MVSIEHDASEVDVLLYQMILFCGEFFHEDFLKRCPRSLDYFQLDCRPYFLSLYSFSDPLPPLMQVAPRNVELCSQIIREMYFRFRMHIEP